MAFSPIAKTQTTHPLSSPSTSLAPLYHLPFKPPSTASTPLSTYEWDPSKRNAWSCALQSPPRQKHLQLSADAISAQQANKHLHSALMAAAKLIKLRKSMPSTNNLPQQSQSPCFDHECKLLRHQWQQAKNRQPGAQATILLLAQLQHTMSRKRRQYNGHQIMQFSQLLKSGPRKFWQKARTPLSLLPAQLQTPAAWEPYLTHLTAPAPHSATHMPPPHQPQPPPAHPLNHPFTTEEVRRGLRHLHNGRSGALQGYTSEVLR